MLKRISAVLAAFVLFMTGLVALTATPANAYSTCPSTSRCAFAAYDGISRVWEADGQDYPSCFNVQNNVIASVDNIVTGSSRNLRLYRDTDNCTGDSGLVYAGTQGNMAGVHYKSANSVYVF